MQLEDSKQWYWASSVNLYSLCLSDLLSYCLRLLDTNFERPEKIIMSYTVRKVLASLVEFSNVDDVASCVAQEHMIFVTKRVVAKTSVDRVW